MYCRPMVASLTNISGITLLAGLVDDLRDERLVGIAVDSERKSDDRSTDTLGRIFEKNVFGFCTRAVFANVEFGADSDARAGNPRS